MDCLGQLEGMVLPLNTGGLCARRFPGCVTPLMAMVVPHQQGEEGGHANPPPGGVRRRPLIPLEAEGRMTFLSGVGNVQPATRDWLLPATR